MRFSKLFRVKEGKLERVRDWMNELSTSRQEEALGTFEYENVTREVVAIFKGNDGHHYLIGLNEVTEPSRTADPTVSINQEHSKFKKECLEPISEKGEVLFDLQAG